MLEDICGDMIIKTVVLCSLYMYVIIIVGIVELQWVRVTCNNICTGAKKKKIRNSTSTGLYMKGLKDTVYKWLCLQIKFPKKEVQYSILSVFW